MSLTEVASWAKSALAEHLTESLYNYSKDGLGFTLYEKPHRGMCDFGESVLPPPPDQMLQATKKRSMYLAPRETLKTSLLCQGLAEYFLLKFKRLYNYDGRVAIVRGNREYAETVIGAVRQDFEIDGPIKQAFGDLKKDSPNWTSEGISLNWRTKSYREPSIFAASVGYSLTSMHFDLIIVDDAANETNYLSDRDMTRAWTYINSLYPVLNAWGSILVLGTRWSHLDPYGRILSVNKDAKEQRAGTDRQEEVLPWSVQVHGAYEDDGTLFYPDFLTERRLQDLRETIRPSKMFVSQYLNKVTTDESMVFKPENMLYYEGTYDYGDGYSEPPTLHIRDCSEPKLIGRTVAVRCQVFVDTATSSSKYANSTGIIVRLLDAEGRWWIDAAYKNREPYSATIQRIANAVEYYAAESLSIEVVSANELWVPLMNDEFRRRNIRCPIKRYHPKQEARGAMGKDRRIEAMEWFFSKHQVFIRRGLTPLIDEMQTYDGTSRQEHFDLLDALSQGRHDLKPPRSMAEVAQALEDAEEDEELADEPGQIVRAVSAGYGS